MNLWTNIASIPVAHNTHKDGEKRHKCTLRYKELACVKWETIRHMFTF